MAFYKLGRFEIILEHVSAVSETRQSGAVGQVAYDVLVDGAPLCREKPSLMPVENFREEREDLVKEWHRCMSKVGGKRETVDG